MVRPHKLAARPGWSDFMTLLDRFRTQSRDKHSDPAVRLAFVDEMPLIGRGTTIAAMRPRRRGRAGPEGRGRQADGAGDRSPPSLATIRTRGVRRAGGRDAARHRARGVRGCRRGREPRGRGRHQPIRAPSRRSPRPRRAKSSPSARCPGSTRGTCSGPWPGTPSSNRCGRRALESLRGRGDGAGAAGGRHEQRLQGQRRRRRRHDRRSAASWIRSSREGGTRAPSSARARSCARRKSRLPVKRLKPPPRPPPP